MKTHKNLLGKREDPRWKGRGVITAVIAGVGILSIGLWFPLHSQGIGNAIKLAPPVNALNVVGIPDVNAIGLLDKQGVPGGIVDPTWPKITNPAQRIALQQLGKALFWDMQVGGDGIQACASCHYHAGADHRATGQMSPGFKGGDFTQDLLPANNGTLTTAHFGLNTTNRGLPASETAKITAGATPDLADGTPGTPGGKPAASEDINDVVSSQGPRAGAYAGLSGGREDRATLATSDDGFNHDFPSNLAGIPDTVRRVEPRNTPTVLNAVYNLRNFWDGRADPFFNGRNPLGFRDPDAMVKVASSPTGLADERLLIPMSSLASQAVGPIGSDFEMVFGPRPVMDLGRKLVNGATPLAGQLVACDDPLLGSLTNCTTPGTTNRGLTTTNYAAMIQAVFDARFWDSTFCVNPDGTQANVCTAENYRLMEYNFPLFFGLAVQAYEATLTTEDTIVDLLVGGKVTGTLTLGKKVVNTQGISLDACIANLQANNGGAAVAAATTACANHYAKFIHPRATAGSEANATGTPVTPNASIGGCATPTTCTASPNQTNGVNTLLAVNRGMGRFFAGATGCSICHFNPEFTGATVSTLTGFGAGPAEPTPPGQVRRLERRVLMERMIAFNGLATVYDSGFYNLGVRPTPEDISIGDSIGVPLAMTKLMLDIQTAPAGSFTARVGALIPNLFQPTGTNNLTPVPFATNLQVACGPGLVAPRANNNPNNGCVPTIVPGERLLRNGAFKASGLRNVKFTGPYFHNGSTLNLRQVLEFYKTAGHFPNLNLNNLDAGLKIFSLGVTDEASVVEMLETGLTDWRVAYEEGKFSHPEICIPNGHDPFTGQSKLAGIPAVGASGNGTNMLQTFQDNVSGVVVGKAHTLTDSCTVSGISAGGLSTIDVPPAPLLP